MRSYFLLLLTLFIFISGKLLSQAKSYEAQWKKVDELIEKKNLPKSGLAEVKKIYALAKKDQNDVQTIKCLVYITDLQDETREDNEAESIKDIEKEIATAKEPVRSILYRLLANLYWQYFQNNRYDLYDRTNTVNFDKKDIATWTADDFHKKITELFLQSIKDQLLLKQTRLEPFDEIISKGNLRNLRPTLFDLLAHKALEYFKDDEHDIQKPAYAFEINEPEAFAPTTDFISHKFITRDSLSLQQKALLIYQDLASFHLNDAKPDALIDVEIERIEFVHDNATMENKNDLYKSALENIIGKYPSNYTANQASFSLASYYNDLASGYDPQKDTSHRYDRIKAKEILERVIKDSAVKSQGWVNSYNLLKEITKKSFSFEIEKVNIPDQPFRTLINYTNITNLNLRLIKVPEGLRNRQDGYSDAFWNALIKTTPFRSWKQSLPATNDCQQHSVEIKVDGLPPGEYFLLAAEDKFENKGKALSQQLFYVSNISFIHNQEEFFVLHRETGEPLANTNVQVWERYFDRKTSTYKKEKTLQFRTDVNGYFKFIQKDKTAYRSCYFDITYNNDHLFLNDEINEYAVISQKNIDTLADDKFEKQHLYTYLFTDRSIYRPGQIIYFKGISITRSKDGKSKIQPNYKNTIYLRNANYQAVDSMNITTNEFGSFSGKFQLPSNTLNRSFTLYMKEYKGQQPIQVEEYKRPKFYVELEKIKASYKVNDTIYLTGNAKAYAGNVIDEGKVSYRVVRQARFLYDWIRWWQPESDRMEITHGEITTDATGKFSIQFAAIPDRSIKKETEPVFDYHVYVDITDINGETRSNETVITAGYKSLLLKTEVEERIPVDSFKTISIRTENMNGEYQPSLITVSVYKLIPEQRLIRNRLWDRPDQYVMSKGEFISYFPHDEYATEADFKTWQREKQVYSRTDSSKLNGEWSMANSKLADGYYAIEIVTKDMDGQQVKDIKYVELFNPQSNQLNKPEYLWTKASDETIEPGKKTSIQIGTSANVFLIKRKDQLSSTPVVNYSFERVHNTRKNFEFSATEADRGSYGLNFFFVRDNRLYSFNDVIEVPWSNKELNIEYLTFRDKTLPGNQEKCKVKITGYKNEKLAAEMLASMYDASLDQFYYHEWIKPYVWKNYENYVVWNGDNFSSIESREKWISEYDGIFSGWSYDELNLDMYSLIRKNQTKRYGVIYEKLSDAKIDVMNQEGVKDETVIAGWIGMQKFTPPVIKKDMAFRYSLSSNFLMADGDFTKQSEMFVEAPYIKKITDSLSQTNGKETQSTIQPRKNFNETAFFFPDLKTDENGAIEFSFTAPEALTKWKLQTLAHTKELAFGLSKKELVTQKKLMVQPNMPRFLRQGDKIELVSKIVNLSEEKLKGQAQLELFDATTNQPLKDWISNSNSNKQFTVAAGQSASIKFLVEVPMQFNNIVTWRVTAKSGNYSDAEENIVPVLSNKVLVTETLPLPMKGTGTKNFTFEKLLQSGHSKTLQHQSLAVEYTSNPAWYAVQALPYLMEFPYECAEQTWNRYYANSLATKIANSSPRIKQIFEQWKTLDTAALLSNLQKNQELKSALLEETPWVLDAKSEEQQKKNIALLFDMVKMSNELNSKMNKLKDLLNSNGSFPWFKGGNEDRYITQYILTGIGHLKKLNAITKEQEKDISSIATNGLAYLDKKIKDDYAYLVKHPTKLNDEHIGDIQIQYLYMRSFFSKPIPQASQTAFNFYKKQAQTYWKRHSKQLQGMIALTLYRSGDLLSAKAILNSLKETSITNDELGTYWKDNSFGYSWYWSYAPIETQALMIEAFNEINKDSKTVDDLKTWLIKNKQTNNWSTTKATANACYAMLLQGTDWLSNELIVEIQLGNTIVNNRETQKETGTGYFKQTIGREKVQPQMANISVTIQSQKINNNSQRISSSWGSIYWQYFEDMDKVTNASTPLQLTKKLFIQKNSDNGPVLTPVEDGTKLHIGDKIKVRIELRVDRDMEYMHMKDMRASALEPVNVLSEYKWQGSLGYYETTKDVSTSFFFDHLYKGTYVFEYPLFISHSGSFSNGITTIQCMYAPEFSAHSEGAGITVE